jgi:hypothetical protein
VQFLQLGTRLDAQSIDQQLACLMVDGKCFSLTAASVERQHQPRAEDLTERLFKDQSLQLGHKRGGVTQLDVGVDAPFQRLKPNLVQPRRLSCSQQVRRDVS